MTLSSYVNDFDDSSSTRLIVLLSRFSRAIVCLIILDAKNVFFSNQKMAFKIRTVIDFTNSVIKLKKKKTINGILS